MEKKKETNQKNNKRKKQSPVKWIVSIFFITLIISAGFSFLSNSVMESFSVIGAIIVTFIIILIGIIFDLVGVSVTAVDVGSIHGMASRKVKGASEAILLIDKADKVASICNDVIGDICGVVSGAAAAVIAARLLIIVNNTGVMANLIPIVLSSLVAAFTVSGKAIGKNMAMNNSTQIVLAAGKVIAFFKGIFSSKKRK